MWVFIFNHLVLQTQQLFWQMCQNIWLSSGAVWHMYRNTWTLSMNLWNLYRYGNFYPVSNWFLPLVLTLCRKNKLLSGQGTSAMIFTIWMFYSANCRAMIFFSSLLLAFWLFLKRSFLRLNYFFSALWFFFFFRMSQQLKEWNYSPRKQWKLWKV